MSNVLEIYTDGAALGNPGKGGYGIVMKYGKAVKEMSHGYAHTTNNRMELLAVIVALECIKKPDVLIKVYTDSKYVHDAIQLKWLNKWIKTGFKDKKNPDLWMSYWKVAQTLNVHLHWVKGHAGHPENERCDVLATTIAKQGPWSKDHAYENTEKQSLL